MSDTPYYDAYIKYKALKNNSNVPYTIRKKYVCLSSGETVLEDIEFFDSDNNKIITHDIFTIK